MKLKTKLIPLVSAASVAAVAIPLATTSCGLTRYTNMLAEYVPGVTPYKKTTIDGTPNANEVYRDRAVLNTDIIRDDILFTYSQCLNTKESRDKINYLANFTTYDLDIGIDWVKDESGVNYLRLTYYAHVVGEAAHAEVGEYANVTKFDFNIKCSFSNLGSSTMTGFKGETALKDYYVMWIPGWFIPGGSVIIDVATKGSMSYIDDTAKKEIEIPDFDEHSIFTAPEAAADMENYVAFYPFWEFVAAIPYVGMFDYDVTEFDLEDDVTGLYYASHYFKDVTII